MSEQALPDQERQPAWARRALLVGAGITCAAMLTGCSTYDADNAGPEGTPASSSGGGAASGGAAAGGTPGALASTAEVPAGGGTVNAAKKIVITQPQAGSFKGFSAVCTHQGCLVNTVSDGTINCPCHGSKFSIKDGSVVNGPAASPLPAVPVKVEGTSIVQG